MDAYRSLSRPRNARAATRASERVQGVWFPASPPSGVKGGILTKGEFTQKYGLDLFMK